VRSHAFDIDAAGFRIPAAAVASLGEGCGVPFAVACCRHPGLGLDLGRVDRSVEDFLQEQQQQPAAFAMLLGDQIYADATAGLVPDVALTAIPDAYGAWGEGFYVCDGDKTQVYLADGTQVFAKDNITVVGDYAIEGAFGGVNIYGPDYTQVSTKLQYPSQRLDLLEGGYLRHYDDGAYSVLDLQGNSVCADTFQDVDRVVEGCIIACKEAFWGMTAVSGEEILPYAYAAIEYLGDGLFLLEETSGSKILYDLAGVQTDVTNFERSGCCFYKQTPAGREYLLRNGSTRTFAGEVEELDHGLLLTPNGLFELYSGTRFFLDYDYDRFEYCDGFVYARMHGIWTVFQIEIVE
jgi:hypothetical protein